jgi:hypothetical protein
VLVCGGNAEVSGYREFCKVDEGIYVEALVLVAEVVASIGELDIDCGEESEMTDAVLGGRESVPLTYVTADERVSPEHEVMYSNLQ